jgi:alpha-1,6-mannosyltransferase
MSCERMDDNLEAYMSGSSLSQWFSRWYLGRIYIPQFDWHIANSQYTAAELRSSLVPRHYRGVSVCPAGVDCQRFHPARRSAEARRRLLQRVNAAAATTLLVYAGRIAPEKNISLLPRMMRHLLEDPDRSYLLLCAGAGPDQPKLAEDFSVLAPGRVRFLGHIHEREALADLLANCDVFIHPNPREPFGIAPLEAMASGLPLVAPSSGGLLAYANSRNCWLAPATGKGFAQAVRSVLAEPEVALRRAGDARQTAEEHDWPVIAEQLFQLYDALHLERQCGGFHEYTPLRPSEEQHWSMAT